MIQKYMKLHNSARIFALAIIFIFAIFLVQAKVTCTDSETGINPYLKGCTTTSDGIQSVVQCDSCSGDIVIDYNCGSPYTQTCSYGCKDGACQQSSGTINNCPAGTENYYCSSIDKYALFRCESGVTKKYSCASNILGDKFICKSGQCVMEKLDNPNNIPMPYNSNDCLKISGHKDSEPYCSPVDEYSYFQCESGVTKKYSCRDGYKCKDGEKCFHGLSNNVIDSAGGFVNTIAEKLGQATGSLLGNTFQGLFSGLGSVLSIIIIIVIVIALYFLIRPILR